MIEAEDSHRAICHFCHRLVTTKTGTFEFITHSILPTRMVCPGSGTQVQFEENEKKKGLKRFRQETEDSESMQSI